MSIVAWLIVGLIAGFLGSKIVNKRGEGVLLDIVLGVVGAFVGGFVSRFLGFGSVDGLNIGSIAIATVGAVIFLVLYHAVIGRRMALAASLADGRAPRGRSGRRLLGQRGDAGG